MSDFGEELACSLFDNWHHMAQTIPRADGNGACDEHAHAGAWLTSEYAFEASGQWMDGTIKCGPAGVEKSHFQIGEIAQLAGSALGQAEKLYQTLSHDKQADFWWTKRVENYDWFTRGGDREWCWY